MPSAPFDTSSLTPTTAALRFSLAHGGAWRPAGAEMETALWRSVDYGVLLLS
jgi:hypothetical protein